MDSLPRRQLLRMTGGACVAGVAGCVGDLSGNGGPRDPDEADDDGSGMTSVADSDGDNTGVGPPTTSRGLPLEYTIDELMDESRSGGPPPDGIPAIEQPEFAEADDPPANLDPGDPVFGVQMNGDTKAYPQYTLVWHEIVNDELGGEPVSVTYCPLTGTAQGFVRGETTFGVSGQLINSNLVMFDRGTESWWPQMLAVGITGEHEGAFLAEFQVIWTTWERWQTVHPDTLVLTENTGHARNYGRDPYGSYNPRGGYYTDDSALFPALTTDDRFYPKDVVLGMRNRDGAMCVPKDHLRDAGHIEGTVGGVPYLTVYEPALDTGFVYRNPNDIAVTVSDGEVTVGGRSYPPDELPLDREIAYDALWMAWYGYYPSTVVHE